MGEPSILPASGVLLGINGVAMGADHEPNAARANRCAALDITEGDEGDKLAPTAPGPATARERIRRNRNNQPPCRRAQRIAAGLASTEDRREERAMYYATDYRSPIGTLTLVCDETGVAGLWLEGQKYYFGGLPQRPLADGGSPVLSKAKAWLERYFAKDRPMASELPLAPAGGAFRQGVWELLCQIPYGQIVTYGELAARVAKRMQRPRMSAQAVGGAVGHNPVSILIPCHRVVGANGSLTGYAGGVEKKRWLLEHEGLDVSALPVPKRR